MIGPTKRCPGIVHSFLSNNYNGSYSRLKKPKKSQKRPYLENQAEKKKLPRGKNCCILRLVSPPSRWACLAETPCIYNQMFIQGVSDEVEDISGGVTGR